jgi:hypothetical protein
MPITVSGTSITFNDATTQTTAFTGGGGTVTSVATGNGLSGGTITTSGTLIIACPSFNSVGSYAQVMLGAEAGGIQNVSSGSNYSAGVGTNQLSSSGCAGGSEWGNSNNLSGTWKWMGQSRGGIGATIQAIACRVS